MAKKQVFTRESFIRSMRREKERKKEWEDRMNKKLDEMEKRIRLAKESRYLDLA